VDTNRPFQFPKRSQLFICARVSARPLRDQTHHERADRPFQFQKRSQRFICTHNETISVVAMGDNHEDVSLLLVHAYDTAPTPSGFREIVSDNFPILHAHKKRRSVWILPQLAAPETHPKLAHVVGGDGHANRAKP